MRFEDAVGSSYREINASNMAQTVGANCYVIFTIEMNKTTPSVTSTSIEPLVNLVVASRSHAPSSPSRKRKATQDDEIGDEYIGKRVAKIFDDSIYFGAVVERLRGPVVAAIADGTRELQAM